MNGNVKTALAFAGLTILIVSTGFLVYALVNRQYPFRATPQFTEVKAYSDPSTTIEYDLTDNNLGTIPNGTIQLLYIKNSGTQTASVTLSILTATNCNVLLNNTSFSLPSNAIEVVSMTIYFTGTNEGTWTLNVAI